MKRDRCLKLIGLTKNQFYYQITGNKGGKRVSTTTNLLDSNLRLEKVVANEDVVMEILDLKLDPDQAHSYRMISAKLNLKGYEINHKKVYRLMKSNKLLQRARKKKGRNFVKYRRVCPTKPLEVLEMDIKYFRVNGKNRDAFVFTVIDTCTRYVLDWRVGYMMKSEQIKASWEYITATYLQEPYGKSKKMEIEIRSDNGKQFYSKLITSFFAENHMNQVFTHPYTPEENGHVESFHSIIGKSLDDEYFATLKDLEGRLTIFYKTYNETRSHGSIKGLPPAIFWALIDLGHVEIEKTKKRKIIQKINVKRQKILYLSNVLKYTSGNMSQKETLAY
jgi:transposase InsO family protein